MPCAFSTRSIKSACFGLGCLFHGATATPLAAIISLFMFINLVNPLEQFILTTMPHLMHYHVLIIALFFTSATQIIYHI